MLLAYLQPRSASSATHHSGLFLPQRDPENPVRLMRTNKETKPSLRALPWRGARGFPIILLRKITRQNRALAKASGGRYPLPLRLAAPPSPGGVRHVWTCRDGMKSNSNRKGEEQRP